MVRYVFKCFIAVIQASTLPPLIVGHLLTRRGVVFVFWLNDHRLSLYLSSFQTYGGA
jgi:hypothetical protein